MSLLRSRSSGGCVICDEKFTISRGFSQLGDGTQV